MCDPVTIALVGGAALGAVSSFKQGKQAKGQAKVNAAINEIEAQDALEIGAQDEARYRQDVAQVMGAQKAEIGARNAERSGTALDLIADTAAIGEADAMTIRNNAAREAYGLRVGAQQFRRAGNAAYSNAKFQAGSTLLTGAAQSYGYYKSRTR